MNGTSPNAGPGPARWLTRIAALSALCLGVAGCSALGGSSGSGSGANPDNLEQPTIRVGVIAAASAVPLYIAQDLGYFKQQGLTVKIVTTSGGSTAIPQLLGGGLDITLTNDVGAISAQAKGTANLKFVFSGENATPGADTIDALPSSGITGPAGLTGKTISLSSLNDVVYLAVNQTLDDDGVNHSSVHFVQIAFPDTEQALRTGQVDAASQLTPYNAQSAQQSGAKTVLEPFAANSPTAGLPIATYVATAAFAAKNPRTVAAFQRAMTKAAQTATSQPATDRREVAKFVKIGAAVVAAMTLPAYPATLTTTDLDRVVTLMRRYGLLAEPGFSAASMILPPPGS